MRARRVDERNKYRDAGILEKGEDGFTVAHVPALKACCSQGKTRAEAVRNIRAAVELDVESVIARIEPVPAEDIELVEVVAKCRNVRSFQEINLIARWQDWGTS